MLRIGCLLLIVLISTGTNANPSNTANTSNTTANKPSIIALAPHIVEMLFEIGAGDQVIGTTDYADYPKQALEIERVGNAYKLKLEKVVTLKPDLIIAWKSGNPSQDLNKLKKLGFTIVYSQPDTFIELAQEFKHFGELTGHATKGKQVSQNILNTYNKLVSDYQNKQPINVFYEVWHQPLTTVAQNAWPQHHLNICRASNPFVEANLDYPQVSVESILNKDIQLIIQPKSSHSQHSETFNWSNYPYIPAVKEQHFIQPNADALHRMTSRSLDEVARLCEQIDQIRSLYHTYD